jgi:hypothetical protein
MMVPDRAVSFLIGKQGATVISMEKQSKTRLEFAKVTAISRPALQNTPLVCLPAC